MQDHVQEARIALGVATDELRIAEGAAEAVLARSALDGEEPVWWQYRYGGLGTCRERLERIALEGGWDERLLSADVIREISVVRRYLVRMSRLGDADVIGHVGGAIRDLDAALAAFGLCALSLREAAYLQSIYAARVGRDEAVMA